MFRASPLLAAALLLLPLPAQEAIDEPIDAAVDRGLAWLAAQQTTDGFWIGLVGAKGRDSYMPLRGEDGNHRVTGHIGVTAICGMAFLAGGYVPGRGRYGDNVGRAVQAVLSCEQENGMIAASGTRMYSHAFATLFLAEVYGMTPNAAVRSGLERATHIIIDSQNRHGAWRYNAFTQDSDLSVTVCQLQALRAARNIGIEVPRTTIERAVAYVKASQVPSGRAKGRYYYNIHGRRAFRKTDQYSIQAAAVTSLVSAGIYDSDLLVPALDFLEIEFPAVTAQYPHHYYFWYGNYYASQAFFHAERLLHRDCFGRYYDALSRHLLADQEEDGRWRNPESEGPGDAFGTAVACILLQIPKQYLPIFQR